MIEAKGRKHLSSAEKEARAAGELRAEPPKRIRIPKWLPESLKAEFRAQARRLIAIGIYIDLDADALGRYLIAQTEYLQAAGRASAAIRAGDSEEAMTWSRVEDRYFAQCRACARDMGLTISARCALVVPVSRTVEVREPDGDLFGD